MTVTHSRWNEPSLDIDRLVSAVNLRLRALVQLLFGHECPLRQRSATVKYNLLPLRNEGESGLRASTGSGVDLDEDPHKGGAFGLAGDTLVPDCRGDRDCKNRYFQLAVTASRNQPAASPSTFLAMMTC